MKYGKVLVSRRENQKFFLLIFTFYDFLYLKNMIWAKKNFRLSRGVAVREICIDDISAVLSATAYKFRLPLVVCAGLMHLILRILKFWNLLRKLRSQKILNFFLNFFQNYEMGWNFQKRCLSGSSNQKFFQNFKILKFS